MRQRKEFRDDSKILEGFSLWSLSVKISEDEEEEEEEAIAGGEQRRDKNEYEKEYKNRKVKIRRKSSFWR